MTLPQAKGHSEPAEAGPGKAGVPPGDFAGSEVLPAPRCWTPCLQGRVYPERGRLSFSLSSRMRANIHSAFQKTPHRARLPLLLPRHLGPASRPPASNSSMRLGASELCPGHRPPSTSQEGRRRGGRADMPEPPVSRLQASLPSLSLPQPVDPKPQRFAVQSDHPSTDTMPEVPEDSASNTSRLAFWTLDVKTFLSQKRLLCNSKASILKTGFLSHEIQKLLRISEPRISLFYDLNFTEAMPISTP